LVARSSDADARVKGLSAGASYHGGEIMAKILIVDDEEHIRYLYSEELSDAGYEVITAENGHLLLERIEKEKPDLVVLDIKMVDYNGLDLLQDIRNKFYDLPVVLCTAYDTFKEDMKSIAADYYVIKSFDLSELKNKIAMALEASADKE
jgi:DNA-binding response OmpR family regulator